MKKLLLAPLLLLSLASFCQKRGYAYPGMQPKAKILSCIINNRHQASWMEAAYRNYGHFVTRATTPMFMQKKGVATIMYPGISSNRTVYVSEGQDVAATSFQPKLSMRVSWRLN
ncbi:hypothetical protein F0L74_07330 [Chitinophaga agrisoli]|uniref:Uncharacterized protein n=1 Tax=Chitinophaga agrisoli TaxID=2607653 RepID=A0A5B2W5B0_9BACT|nr:hypothetical protein [Chitinophaga agrisoli]KAA2245756.1 hypothetical protein F0L74_07330 [Chitinophaga agrisoli]